MYIKRIHIKNIRAISDFEMTFDEPAGWHVLIGDNGSGKSTIVRAVAAALIGPDEIPAARLLWKDWLTHQKDQGEIDLTLEFDALFDKPSSFDYYENKIISNQFILKRDFETGAVKLETNSRNSSEINPKNYNWSHNTGWFSAAYGPFRRFTGGDEKKNVIFEAAPKVGAHLSVFGEDIALTEAMDWLKELEEKKYRGLRDYLERSIASFRLKKSKLEELLALAPTQKYMASQVEDLENVIKEQEIELNNLQSNEKNIFPYIKSFINQSKLLPHNTHFRGFNADGEIVFVDGRGNAIEVVEMSDGYRSILSLMFDLIRQLIRVYGEEEVFKNIKKGKMNIPLPGVVLIDEVDAHLHPTWQTRIGQWFTEYFPNIQFIVTTHSPLVCRASEKGSIWQLAAPVNGGTHQQITGIEKDRLVYGNILDAYGTELFGESPVRSTKSDEKLERLGRLNTRHALGKITKEEEKERKDLLKILKTDDPTGI